MTSTKLLILCQQGIKTDWGSVQKSPSEHTIFQKGSICKKKVFNDINAAAAAWQAKQQKMFKIEKRFRISNWRFLSHKLSLQFMQIQTIQPPDNICNDWIDIVGVYFFHQ